jgi:hypothetical protein
MGSNCKKTLSPETCAKRAVKATAKSCLATAKSSLSSTKKRSRLRLVQIYICSCPKTVPSLSQNCPKHLSQTALSPETCAKTHVPNCPKLVPNCPKLVPNCPKHFSETALSPETCTEIHIPSLSQTVPNCPKLVPSPKLVPNCPKLVPNCPKLSKACPKLSQACPKLSQACSKLSQTVSSCFYVVYYALHFDLRDISLGLHVK